jgi:hypothetical protein
VLNFVKSLLKITLAPQSLSLNDDIEKDIQMPNQDSHE